MYQYCPKMWSLRSLEHASVIQKLTILEHKNGLVLSNTRVPVSGTWSILFPNLFWGGIPMSSWPFYKKVINFLKDSNMNKVTKIIFRLPHRLYGYASNFWNSPITGLSYWQVINWANQWHRRNNSISEKRLELFFFFFFYRRCCNVTQCQLMRLFAVK